MSCTDSCQCTYASMYCSAIVPPMRLSQGRISGLPCSYVVWQLKKIRRRVVIRNPRDLMFFWGEPTRIHRNKNLGLGCI